MIEDTALQLRAKLRAFGVSLNQLDLPASSDYPLQFHITHSEPRAIDLPGVTGGYIHA